MARGSLQISSIKSNNKSVSNSNISALFGEIEKMMV
jgi:hypothetical protein